MQKEIRKTGDGKFYLVNVDDKGHSFEVYLSGTLLTFDTKDEAKDYSDSTHRMKAKTAKIAITDNEEKVGRP